MPEDKQPVNITLLLGSREVPVWQYEMVERLVASPNLNIAMVLVGQRSKPSYRIRCLNIVTGIFSWVEKRVSGWQGNARRLVDLQPLLETVPRLDPADTTTRQVFIAAELDLVIDLQGGASVADYCFATSSGQVWRYFYDGTGALAAEQAGVREYAAGENGLVSGVLSLDGDGEQHGLLHAVSGVDRPLFTQNLDQLLWKMVDFMPLLLWERGGALPFAMPPQREKRLIPLKDILNLTTRSLCQASRKLTNKLHWYYAEEQWILLLGQRSLLKQPKDLNQLPKLTKIIPPPDRFWADPFLWHEAGRDYIFFEELVYRRDKGRLVCMELFADGGHSEPQVILEQPYHLSYPFLFRYQGRLYMIPESAENHTLDLYRCEQFPQQWTKVKTIMSDVEAYDATLYEDEQGRWWLFVCMRQHEYASTNELLYLFSAPGPLSEQWEAHPANPVVTDAATARPAGNLLRLDGKLYRPSQNCAGSYGQGINLNEIITLNRQTYREQASSQFIASGQSGLAGIHTLNCLNEHIVSDGILLHQRRRFGHRHGP